MGAPPPLPPPAIEAPQDRVRMGEAMAVPEHVDPFVPCDPKPGFAPPPPPTGEEQGEIAPVAPPAPERPAGRELMGDVAAPEPEMGKIAAPKD